MGNNNSDDESMTGKVKSFFSRLAMGGASDQEIKDNSEHIDDFKGQPMFGSPEVEKQLLKIKNKK